MIHNISESVEKILMVIKYNCMYKPSVICKFLKCLILKIQWHKILLSSFFLIRYINIFWKINGFMLYSLMYNYQYIIRDNEITEGIFIPIQRWVTISELQKSAKNSYYKQCIIILMFKVSIIWDFMYLNEINVVAFKKIINTINFLK